MLSLVYLSSESYPYTDSDLATSLTIWRANNQRLDITGVLLYRDGQILQLLEGPEDAVRTMFAVIALDPRHKQVQKLSEEIITERDFPNWSMGYPPAIDTRTPHLPGLKQYLSYLRRNTPRDGITSVAQTVSTSGGRKPSL
ncbi:BLUF domain-containing protein [Frigoribacterium sp. CG_9.8]|uniref:BLUF domain-containing protein n=1 Tax=Frigoribacterium sp. CG_9.8 TaxID=2787733 RepID=UPI0018C96C7B|nr:acylphosphatase [Frigoribacterium sp. CG_9.8]